MGKIAGQSRFSRPAGSKEPFRFRHEAIKVAQPVHIGQRDPGDYFTSVSHEWVPQPAQGGGLERSRHAR